MYGQLHTVVFLGQCFVTALNFYIFWNAMYFSVTCPTFRFLLPIGSTDLLILTSLRKLDLLKHSVSDPSYL
jgi:hypothetical protein